jgi:hypothetical protein
MRRVVVTGMGIVSSIGNNTQEVLASLREAKSGISRADKYAELGFRCQVHGAPTLNAEEAIDRRAMRFSAAARPGTMSPWSRPFATPGSMTAKSPRNDRHHHGVRRALDAGHRRGRRHRP